MVTMDDVAKAAGVSIMTVSNVLNGRHNKVSQRTVAKVLAQVDELGYIPNAQARTLSGKSSGIIALIYAGEPEGVDPLANPHDAEFVGASESEVSRADRYLMIRSGQDLVAVGTSLRTWNVDGAIFLGVLGSDSAALKMIADVPLVFVDNYAIEDAIDRVNIDDFRGGYLAGRHLVQAGHTDIGFVRPGMSDVGVVKERHDGFQAALRESGISLSENRHWYTDSNFDDARRLAAVIAEDPPTALFSTADISALGLMKGFIDRGLSVPNDISIVGFDDLEACRYVTPQLTTIRQNVSEKARQAVRMLLDRIDSGESRQDHHLVLPVELIDRGSVADLSIDPHGQPLP